MQFLVDFTRLCNDVSEPKLKKLMKVVSLARKRRFRHGNKMPKYGTMNKGFTEYELRQFLKVIKNPKHLLLFKYQAMLALRVGEAVKLNMEDVNIVTRELKIYAPKISRVDYLLIPESLFNDTLKYYQMYEEEIKTAKGFLFFKGESHIDESYVRNRFREYCVKAGLNEVYAISDDVLKEQRRLFRLTTHSLRHYAITRCSIMQQKTPRQRRCLQGICEAKQLTHTSTRTGRRFTGRLIWRLDNALIAKPLCKLIKLSFLYRFGY